MIQVEALARSDGICPAPFGAFNAHLRTLPMLMEFPFCCTQRECVCEIPGHVET